MNTLRLRSPDGREPFDARVTKDGRWLVKDERVAWELHVLAMRYAERVGYSAAARSPSSCRGHRGVA